MKLIKRGSVITLVPYGEEATIDTLKMNFDEAKKLVDILIKQTFYWIIGDVIREWKEPASNQHLLNFMSAQQITDLIAYTDKHIEIVQQEMKKQSATNSPLPKRRKLDPKGSYSVKDLSSDEDDNYEDDVLLSDEEKDDLEVRSVTILTTKKETLERNVSALDLVKAPDGSKQPANWIEAVKSIKNHIVNWAEYTEALSLTIGIDTAQYQPLDAPILFAYEGGKQPAEGGFILSILNQYKRANTRLVEPFVGSARIFLNSDFLNYRLADRDLILITFHHATITSTTLAVEYDQKVNTYIHQYNGEQDLFNISCAILNDTKRDTLQTWLTADTLNLEQSVARDNWARSYIFVRNRGGRNPHVQPGKVKATWSAPTNSQALIQREKDVLTRMRQKGTHCEIDLWCCNWEHTFQEAEQDCIIYADPPYAPFSFQAQTLNKTDSTYRAAFGWEQQTQIAKLAREKAQTGIPVFISNHFTIDLLKLYQSYGVTKIYTYCWKPSEGKFACLAAFLPR